MNGSLDPAELIAKAAEKLEPQALGTLVALLSDWLFEGSRHMTLKLLVRSGLAKDMIIAPDFIEGLGPERLKSKQLIKLAFMMHKDSPSGVLEMIEGLLSAGAINVYSSSAVEELHAGIAQWQQLELKAALLTAIVSSVDNFAQAGLFLSLFLECPESCLEADDATELLERVLSDGDVQDLAGEAKDLADYLPDYADVVNRTLIASEADEDGSEADEEGNLAGFVDDRIEYDTDYSGSDEASAEDEGDEGSSEGESGDSSEDDGNAKPRRRKSKAAASSASSSAPALSPGHKRPRFMSSDTADSSVAAAAAAAYTTGRKRLRRQGDINGKPASSAAKEAKKGAPSSASASAAKGKSSKSKGVCSASSRYVDGEAGVGAGSDDEKEKEGRRR